MIRVQICFSGDADLTVVKKQLEDLQKEGKYEFYHCFLPRHIVEEKGFNSAIVNMLDEVLGDNQVKMLEHCETYRDAMEYIKEARKATAERVNYIYALGTNVAPGIADEISLFTNGKVVLM